MYSEAYKRSTAITTGQIRHKPAPISNSAEYSLDTGSFSATQ